MSHRLMLYTDRLDAKAAFAEALPAATRAVYVAEGMAGFTAGAAAATLSANSAWFNTGPTAITAGSEGAVLLRYELHRADDAPSGPASGGGVQSELTREAEMALDDADGYLLRCDRVDLPPGGVAYTHTHQGGGIRCIVEGAFNVQVMGKTHAIDLYESWYERGPDPVLAWAPDDRPGCFSRVMILPRRLKGQSSIRYVKPEDRDRPKPQKYTIFLDQFIEV